MTAPGWYPDPQGAPVARWWDGTQWTPYTRDPIAEQMLDAQRQQARHSRAIHGLIVGVLIAAFVIYAIVRINANINGGG